MLLMLCVHADKPKPYGTRLDVYQDGSGKTAYLSDSSVKGSKVMWCFNSCNYLIYLCKLINAHTRR